jgi:hypothetical protein
MIWTSKGKRIVRPSMAECSGLGLGVGFGGGGTAINHDFLATTISGCVDWHRAGLGTTPDTGIKWWDDQSGSGDAAKRLVQLTGANQPTLNASDAAYNNRATLSFNGSQRMASTAWATAPVVAGMTIALVGQMSGGAAQEAFFDSISAQRMLLDNFAAAGQLRFYLNANYGGVVATNTPCVIVIQCIANSTATTVYKSALTPVLTGQLPGTSTPTGLTIGAAYDGTAGLVGKCAEFAMWNRVLTTPEVTDVLQGLGAYYGITIGP